MLSSLDGAFRTKGECVMKRTDYINWDEYFMGIALLTAMRSKDPSSQVGDRKSVV